MHKLIEYICDELKDIERKSEKGKLSMAEIEYADKLAHMKKNLLKGEELMEEGYSGDGNRSRMNVYPMERSYDRNSMARGRGSQANRDSRGRYASDEGEYGRYGYARDNREVIQNLRELMMSAPDERSRQELQNTISRMEQM